MRLFATLPLLLAISACAATNPPVIDGPAGSGCRSEGLSQFVGQPSSAELGAAMLRASGARIIRWVSVGGAVTMDFSPVRLTAQLDANNRVQSANCG
jgi:hypothetical protein